MMYSFGWVEVGWVGLLLLGLRRSDADKTVGECVALRDTVVVEQAVEDMKYGAGLVGGNTERVLG
jgi:hypothetical protein